MATFSNFGLRPPVEGLTVVGEATRSAQPETIEVSFDVHSVGPAAALALRDNAMKVMQIGQAVTSAGVAQEDLHAGAATVYPMYQPAFPGLPSPLVPQLGAGGGAIAPFGLPAEAPAVAGYHVVSFFKVRLDDVSRLGEVVDAAIRAGANVSGGFLFRLRDEAAIRRGLLADAGRDAKEKADMLASALGKGLGDPVSVLEDFSAYQVGPLYTDGFRDGPFALTPAGAMARLPHAPGELTFHARVSVTYRLQ